MPGSDSDTGKDPDKKKKCPCCGSKSLNIKKRKYHEFVYKVKCNDCWHVYFFN